MDSSQPDSGGSPKRTVGKAAGITSEEIRAKAMEIMAAEGTAGLSMRRLAAELEVTPMAIYHHVGNKEALTAALQRGILDTLEFPVGTTGWQTRLRAAFEAALGAAIAYPQLALVTVTDPVNVDGDESLFGEVREALDEAGIPADRLDYVWNGVATVLGGCVLMVTTRFYERSLPAGARYPMNQAADIAIAYIDSEIAASRPRSGPD